MTKDCLFLVVGWNEQNEIEVSAIYPDFYRASRMAEDLYLARIRMYSIQFQDNGTDQRHATFLPLVETTNNKDVQ